MESQDKQVAASLTVAYFSIIKPEIKPNERTNEAREKATISAVFLVYESFLTKLDSQQNGENN
ncbi:MAG: hypothetical protein MUP85_12510 [Candidatus Lokiarchaeota archaeon]|nr:hypothetical protein [Candidatus Lokiarchaeota archaeon]